MVALAKKRGTALFRMAAHFELGGTALCTEHGVGAAAFPSGRSAPRSGEHRSALAMFGMDLGIFTGIWATHLTWFEGCSDRARARADDTVRMSEAGGHPSHTRSCLRGRRCWRSFGGRGRGRLVDRRRSPRPRSTISPITAHWPNFCGRGALRAGCRGRGGRRHASRHRHVSRDRWSWPP